MKVKNVMFTGFAAAILGGACGAANAADYTLASQGYVTKQLESKQDSLIAGDGIAIDGRTISAVSGLTDNEGQPISVETVLTEVSSAVTSVENKLGDLPEETTVAEALAGKQEVLTNAEVLESITSEDVASIGETADAVETLSGTVGTITNAEGAASTVATEITTLRSGVEAAAGAAESAAAAAGAAQADVDALTEIVNQNATDISGKLNTSVYEQHLVDQKAKDKAQDDLIDGLSGITGDGGSLSQLQETVTKLDGSAEVSGSVANQIAAAIATETERANAAYAPASLEGTVSTLADTVATKADASALNNYVTTSALEEKGYQNKSQVQTEIAGAEIAESQVTGLTTALAGKLNASAVTELGAGTYLVSTDGTTVSYKSVEVIDANGEAVKF